MYRRYFVATGVEIPSVGVAPGRGVTAALADTFGYGGGRIHE